MDFHKKLKQINKRWDISTTKIPEEEFGIFKTRILNIFQGIDQHVKNEDISLFCNILGISENWISAGYMSGTYSTNIYDELQKENDPKMFYRLLEIIFALDIKKDQDYRRNIVHYSRAMLFNKVLDAFEYSNVNAKITAKKDEIIIYPAGEEFLDENLVNPVLSFLNKKATAHFIDALKSYGEKNNKARIKSSESLRRCLEEFLRQKLKNKKGLKANITEISRRLKSEKTNNDVRNIFDQIIRKLDDYFNENSKHGDGQIKEFEGEYLIYQVSVILRYLHGFFT